MNVQRKRIDAFLRLAEEELQAARQLVRLSPRQAAYLTQQCAEKIARAATRYRYPSSDGDLFAPPDTTRLQKDVEELGDLVKEASRFLAQDDK
jgi:hypothetical protein